ncbi:MAG: hypothetical protein P8163_04770 [Candidatus Thiodiazotropha sp.]
MILINTFSWTLFRNVIAASILLCVIPTTLFAETEGWRDREGNPTPESDNLKSIDGFSGWLIITPDPDWEAEWNTSPETTPHFSEASEVAYGEKLTFLTFYGNPKVDPSGNIDIRCDIQVIQPDGTASVDMKDIECAVGKLQGNPHYVRLTSAVMNFIGEENDPPGTWTVNINLTDQNRKVSVPLTSKFELSRTKIAKSVLLEKSRFKSQEDVGKWMMYYYMSPEPDALVEAVEYMSLSGLLDNKDAISPVSGFLAGVFKDNPNHVPEWIGRLKSLKESHFEVVVLGLWYANLPDSQKQVDALLDKYPILKKQFPFLETGSPIDVEKIPLKQGAWVLDALWGKFSATGDKQAITGVLAQNWFKTAQLLRTDDSMAIYKSYAVL